MITKMSNTRNKSIERCSKFYTGNYKTLLIYILKNLNKSRNIPYSWIRRLNIEVCQISTHWSIDLMQQQAKSKQMLTEIYKQILTFIQNFKEPRITKIILNKYNIFERIILLVVKFIIKLVWQFDIV